MRTFLLSVVLIGLMAAVAIGWTVNEIVAGFAVGYAGIIVVALVSRAAQRGLRRARGRRSYEIRQT